MSPHLNKQETKYVQSPISIFLYYAQALYCTMLPAFNQMAVQRAQLIQNSMEKVQRLLDYVNTYSNTALRFYASDMQLLVDSDAAYLVLPKARSQIVGYF